MAIWWSRKKIAKLNSANIKSHGTDRLATEVLDILYAVPAEKYLYTPQRMQCWGFPSLRKGNSYHQREYEARQEQTVALYVAYVKVVTSLLG